MTIRPKHFLPLRISQIRNLPHALLIGLLAVLTPYKSYSVDYWSPRIAALGGSGAAGPLLNDSILLNPSYTSFLPTYAVAVAYSWLSETGRQYQVSVQDGRTELLQAGAAYTMRDDAIFIHFGISKTVVKRLGFGLSTKLIRNNTTTAMAPELVFSTTVIAADWLQFALVADNLLSSAVARSIDLIPVVTLAAKVNVMGIALLYFDPRYYPSGGAAGTLGHSAGLELTVLKEAFLRLGQFSGTSFSPTGRRSTGYGFGAGWIAPRISLDYGFARSVSPVERSEHTVSATIFF